MIGTYPNSTYLHLIWDLFTLPYKQGYSIRFVWTFYCNSTQNGLAAVRVAGLHAALLIGAGRLPSAWISLPGFEFNSTRIDRVCIFSPPTFPEKATTHPEYPSMCNRSLEPKRWKGRYRQATRIHHIISHIANFPISEDQPKTSVTREKTILCSISCRVSRSALISSSMGRLKRLLHALSDTSRLPPFIQPVSSVIIPSYISLVTWREIAEVDESHNARI